MVRQLLLGSCVAACLRDPIAGVGGMNHFLLPGSAEALASGGDATRYGVHLMELLINGPVEEGRATRDRLEAKIFGGAKTITSFSNVGSRMPILPPAFCPMKEFRSCRPSRAVTPGKLEYWPVSGRARQYALTGAETQKTVALESRRSLFPSRSNRPSSSFESGVRHVCAAGTLALRRSLAPDVMMRIVSELHDVALPHRADRAVPVQRERAVLLAEADRLKVLQGIDLAVQRPVDWRNFIDTITSAVPDSA